MKAEVPTLAQGRWQPYPAYKPSGVEWLGICPSHWTYVSVNHIAQVRTGGTPDRDKLEYWTDGTINWMASGEVNKRLVYETDTKITLEGVRHSNASILPVNSVMIALNGQGKTKGMAAILKVEATCNQSLAAIICDKSRLHYAYLFWYLESRYRDIRGLVGDSQRDGLNLTIVKELKLYLPPLDEQYAIAAFLDRETARLDELIAKKQRLIELLQERRAALISHVVTKGLDPNVAMKDSGLKWLGEIPSHWAVRPLKRISPSQSVGVVVNPSHYVVDEGIPFLFGSDVSEGHISVERARRISPESNRLLRKTMLRAGDLVVVRVGYPGVTSVIPPELDGCNCASMMIVRQHRSFASQWLCYAMNSRVGRAQVEAVQYGAAQEQFNISHAVFFMFPVPPRQEQLQIASYLDQETSRIDALIANVNDAIDRLREYRTALISAAVTGKIDVRPSPPAPLPESGEGGALLPSPS